MSNATPDFDILNLPDVVVQDLFIEQWNTTIKIRQWSGTEAAVFNRWFDETLGKPTHDIVFGKIAALSICDAQGNCIYKQSDAPALSKKSSAALKQISDAVILLNSPKVDEKKSD